MAVSAFRQVWVLPLAMFLGTFAWSFVYVSLPFYIQEVSTADPASTLRWTGWILGISPLVTVVTAPIWGRLAGSGNPKAFYVLVELLQGVGFFLMALARTVVGLFFARFVLGLLGAASTFAFIMAGRAGGNVRRDVSMVQSGMTVGQVIGPLGGAVAAARLGFQVSFVLAGLILWGCALFVGWGVPAQPAPEQAEVRAGRVPAREVSAVCLLVLVGSIHVFFLTAILPQVLPPLGVAPGATLEASGFLLFASGIAAALGSLAAPWIAGLVGDRRAVAWCLGASSVALAALGLPGEVWGFGAVRCLQSLSIAPVFPLAVAGIAQRASGGTIGLVNSSRIGAAFLGPVMATTLLTWIPPAWVYAILAGLGLALVPLGARIARTGAAGREIAP